MKRISFIITYFNEPQELLRECIDSVLSLPIPVEEREILLIDDGSIVPAPKFDGVTVVSQDNQGLSAARNRGVEMAQGEYIQFLDADDFLLTAAYQQVLELQLTRRPDMLMFDFTHSIPKKESGLKGIKQFCGGVEFLRTCNMRSSACCYMFRKSILGDLRFHLGIVHEDELFTPQLLLKAKSVLVAETSPYYYRIRTATITHQQGEAHIQKRMRDMLFVIRELDRMAKATQGKEQEGLGRRVCQLTMDYIYNCWKLTHSFRETMTCLRSLRKYGFFPLPLRCYTIEYLFFALIANTLCVFL